MAEIATSIYRHGFMASMDGISAHFDSAGSFTPTFAKNHSCPNGGLALIKSGNIFNNINLCKKL